MPWVEVFAAFVVCHLAGDYLLQTNWQAANKFGGLGPDATARHALMAHIASYALVFVPVLVWMADDLAASVLWLAAVALPHLVQDDGRLLDLYLRRIKRCEPNDLPAVRAAVDQAFHIVALFALAVVAGA
ncbi:MAG: hypothetical protein QOJ35_3525 [Solirubrobacteraceae bacterium]|nr:hypothetical protein [Solirubrobacteraceae bacterium]